MKLIVHEFRKIMLEMHIIKSNNYVISVLSFLVDCLLFNWSDVNGMKCMC